METIGLSGESFKTSRSIFLSKLLKPRKLWSRLQDSYVQWRDRHAWFTLPSPPAHARRQPSFRPDDRAWTMPQTQVPRARLRMRPRRMRLVRTGRGFGLEAMEPRLLLSADISYMAQADGAFTLRMDDVDGVATVRLMDTAQGLIVASAALTDIDGSSGAGVRVISSNYDVRLTIDSSIVKANMAGGIAFEGGTGEDSLLGSSLDTIWTLMGEGSGQMSSNPLWTGVSFTGLENLMGAADNEDTFVVQAGGGLAGVMDGGAGGFDSMVLDGGTFENVSYSASGPNSGHIERDGQRLNYDGLEPITDNSNTTNRVVTTSGDADTATLTQDGTSLTLATTAGFVPTFESITFNLPSTSLTVNLGGDQGVPFYNKDTLTVGTLDLGNLALIINGEDGNDEVTFAGNVTAGTIVVNAESITVNSTINAGVLTFTAEVEEDGSVPLASNYLGLYVVADSGALIDLTGATLNVAGAVMLTATSTFDINADPAVFGTNVFALAGLAVLGSAEIKVHNTQLTAGSLLAHSKVDVGYTLVDDADANAADNVETDAAVTIVYLETEARTVVSGNANLQVSGNVSLKAETLANVNATADGGTDSGNIGATLALTIVNLTTEAEVTGSSTINATGPGADVTVQAIETATVVADATSTAGGASEGDGSNRSQQRLDNPDKDANTNDKVKTADGDVNFAGAIALSFFTSSTTALIDTTGSVSAGGSVDVSAQATENVTTSADGSNTGSGAATGVGIAVAFSLTDSTTSAGIGGPTLIDAGDGVSVSAELAAGNSYTVSATSGAGESTDLSVAGAVAIHVLSTSVEAAVLDDTTLAAGTDLSLSATNTTSATTTAAPHDADNADPADNGIGASVAVASVDNLSSARIAQNADLSGAADVSMEATGTYVTTTTAKAGGAGESVGFGGAFAISVVDNTTQALVQSGSELTVASLSATATHTGTTTTKALGDAVGGTAVGATIALSFVDDVAVATTARDITATAGGVSFSVVAEASSLAEAKASAKGTTTQEEGSNSSADDQVNKQTELANSKSGDGDAAGQSADDGNGGSVGVAAALALNVASARADASIVAPVAITAAGAVSLTSELDMDAEAVADGAAAGTEGDGGTTVGVAVALNVANLDNVAVLGAGAFVSSQGFTASATMKGGDTAKHKTRAKATSGASEGDTGVAGSFALNVVNKGDDVGTRAAIENDAVVQAGFGNVLIEAESTSENTVEATAAVTGGGATGVGVSIGVHVVENTTEALLLGTLLGGDDVTLTADGSHDSTTKTSGGASPTDPNATGVGGSFAITVADNATRATLDGGPALNIGGSLAATANHHGSSLTEALGQAQGSTAVGASIALSFVNDEATASTARNIVAGGAVAFGAHADATSQAKATASVAGASSEEDDGGNTANEQLGKQKNTANSKGGPGSANAPGEATADDGSGGSVGVAAALALNVASSTAEATIGSFTTITANGGQVVLQSSNNMDASAVADGSNVDVTGADPNAATDPADTAVGAAVAINVADMRNVATVGSSANVSGLGFVASATMKQADGESLHSYAATAKSGAAAGETGVAGSFALNIVNPASGSVTEAAVRSGATVNANTNDVNITAANRSESEARAEASATAGKTGVGASIAIHVIDQVTEAQLESGATLTGGDDVTLSASGEHDNTTYAQGGAGGNGTTTAVGGSFALTIADHSTEASLGTGTGLNITGDFSATATHHGDTDTTAEGKAQASDTAVGAAIALAFVTDDALASSSRSIRADGDVSLSALADGASLAQATASAKGADKQKESANGNTTADQQKNKQVGVANSKNAGADKSAGGTTSANDGSGGSVGVGAALALNIAASRAEASVLGGTTDIIANDDGVDDGAVSLTSTNNMDAQAIASGEAVGPSVATAVGVAIAINVADMRNAAVVGTGVDVDGDGFTASATMKNAGDTTHTFEAKATAGASATDTGVAGAFALNIVNPGSGSLTEAGIQGTGNVNAGTGNVVITAASNTDNEARAEAKVDGGATTGVGAAIVVQVVDNDVFARVANGATLTGGNNVTLSATGSHDTTTFARGGAAGSETSVGGSFAIVVADNKTQATLGTGTGLNIDGNFSATATHHGNTSNTAKGDSAGATAVGAAIALSFVSDEAVASTARNLLADGSIAFTANADGKSTVDVTASAAGTTKSKENTSGSTKANDQTSKQTALADQKSGKTNEQGTSRTSANSSSGDVSVAAAIGLNVAESTARASIASGLTVRADVDNNNAGTGTLSLQASNNMDATTNADGKAKTSSGGDSVGVAVAINVADMTNEASIGTGSTISADGLTLRATMKDLAGDAPDTHRFGATSLSGASGGDIGVAGSVAINVATTDTIARVGSGSSVTLNGSSVGDVNMAATSRTDNTVSAKSKAQGGDTGVGASIAVNIALNDTIAEVQNGTSVGGSADDFSIKATNTSNVSTTAEAGAAGSTAVGGGIAVTVSENDTVARMGSGGGGTIALSGGLEVEATHGNTVYTLSNGEAAGSGVGVGASVSINIVVDDTTADVGHSFSGADFIDVIATSTINAKAESKASAEGGSSKKSDGTTDSDNADQESANQSNFATNKGGTSTKPQNTTSAQSGLDSGNSNANSQSGSSTGSSNVKVAATVAVNFMDADNEAIVGPNVSLSSSGAAKVEAIGHFDGQALATATSTDISSDTGVAGAVAVNIGLADNQARVGSGASINAGSVAVRAVMADGEVNTWKSRALAGAVSNGDGIGGSISVNYLDVTTLADVGNNASLTANSGGINVEAESHNELQNIAGGAGLGIDGAGVGIAVAVNVLTNPNDDPLTDTEGLYTGARVGSNATLNASAAGGVNVSADAELLPVTESLPVLGEVDVTSFAAGIAGSGSSTAVGGSASVNVIEMKTEASVGDGSTVSARDDIDVSATDQLELFTGAGSLGASGGGTAVGIGIDVTVAFRDTLATVGGGASLTSTQGDITVDADADDKHTAIAASFGLSAGSGAGVAGSIEVAVWDTETRATVQAGTALDMSVLSAAQGDVSVTANGDFEMFALAGGVSFGLSGSAVGISGIVVVHTDTVAADLQGFADVTAGGANGLKVHATSTDDIVTIAAAGSGSGSGAAVAGSVAVTVLTENTIANLGADSSVNATSVGASNPGVDIYAKADSDLITIAGSLAISAGGAGLGAGVNVATLNKTTEAKIGERTEIDADGNVTVEAENTEDIGSFSVAAGGGSNVGITVSADVFVLTLDTRATIGAQADVDADGSVLVQTSDESDLDLIVGGVAIGGTAGVGVAAGVAVVNKDNQASIGAGASVTGRGLHAVAARTGSYDVEYVAAGVPQDYDPADESGNKPTKSQLEAGAPGGLSQFNDFNQDGNDGDGEVDPGFTGKRSASAAENANFRGVAVSATSKDDIATIALSVGGGGTVGVAIGAAVNVIDVETRATIGSNAQINQATGTANPSQSVLVAAASDFNHIGVGAGAAFGGSGAGAPGVDVSVVEIDTVASINDGAVVDARDDVAVVANAQEKILIVSAGIAFSGVVSLAGGVSVLSLNATTDAAIGANADVDAGGDVAVMASDDTQFTVVSGAVAVGISGAGAAGSVGVVTITKDTGATIGAGAEVDAKGSGASDGITGVLDGSVDGSGIGTKAGAVRGVIVQAESSEKATHVAVAGGVGLYAGIAGGVTVTIFDSDTTAAIGAGAKINNDEANYLTASGVGGSQGVFVGAANRADITSFAGALGVGFVGLAGAVDFGSIKNDTTASIGSGAIVKAAGNVEVHAVADKHLTGFTFSGAGGVVGLGASVSVWSVGEDFSSTYEDSENDGDSDSDDALAGDSGDATSDAGTQAEDGVSGLSTELNAFDSDANSNTANSRVASTMGSATGSLNSKALTGAQLSDRLSTPLPLERGTKAEIVNADVRAGNDIDVSAAENMEVDLLLGNLAAGLVGAGASVAVLNLSGQVTATAGGKLRAGNDIRVRSGFDQEVDVLSVALQGGFVGLGASVVVVNDTSAVRALIASDSDIDEADNVIVSAAADQNFDVASTGVQVGAVAAGASFTQLNVGDGNGSTKEVEASIGNNVDIGKTAAIGNLTMSATSEIDADADTFALAGGAIALTINFAFVDINTDTEVSIGDNVEINATGAVSMSNSTSHDAVSDVFALSVGLGVVGTSIAEANITPTLETRIGANAIINAGSISMLAQHNFNGENADGSRNAQATAEAAGGGLFSGQGAAPTASSNAVATTSVGSGGNLTISPSGNIELKARVNNIANADTNVFSFGAAAIGATLTDAQANGGATAEFGANVSGAQDIKVEALAFSLADARSESAAGGLLAAVSINSSVAEASPEVNARVLANTQIAGIRNLTVEARAAAEGDSRVEGVAIGGVLGAGASDAETTTEPTGAASINAGTRISATGDITVRAEAGPLDIDSNEFKITAADDGEDTITVNGHNLTTGDAIEYDAGGDETVEIGGLNQFEPELITIVLPGGVEIDIPQRRLYGVINVQNPDGSLDDNKIHLGAAFDTANIDSATEIITFAQAHNFISGDRVRYQRGSNDALANFGLIEDSLYYVLVIDDSRIRLVDSLAKATNPDSVFKDFDVIDDVNGLTNVITITNHGFNDGDAVTYDAPEASTFLTGQVDAVYFPFLPNNKLQFVENDNIVFVNDNGDLAFHGFTGGEIVRYNVSDAGGVASNASPICGLVNGETYRVVFVDLFTIQLKHNSLVTTNADFFLDNGVQKFVRTDGGSFIADGFTDESPLSVLDLAPLFTGIYTTVTDVTASTITVSGGTNFAATRVRDTLDFIRGATNADNDRIRLDGRPGFSWSDEGFGLGSVITVTGSSGYNGTYTVLSVADGGTSLVINQIQGFGASSFNQTNVTVDRGDRTDVIFDQGVIELTRPKDLVVNPDNPTGPKLERDSNDLHSLIRLGDLPIGNLQDQHTYYVDKLSDDTFRLTTDKTLLNVVDLQPTTETARTQDGHRIGRLAVDLTAVNFLDHGDRDQRVDGHHHLPQRTAWLQQRTDVALLAWCGHCQQQRGRSRRHAVLRARAGRAHHPVG